MGKFIDFTKKRRSLRSYKSDPVSKEVIESICEAGTWAPSAWNKQPCKFFVLQDPEKIKLASKTIVDIKRRDNVGIIRDMKDPIFYEAPCVILICVDKTEEHPWKVADAAFCAQNCFLQALDLELATVTIGAANLLENDLEIKKQLGIPESWEIILGFCLGKPEGEIKIPERKSAEIIFSEQ